MLNKTKLKRRNDSIKYRIEGNESEQRPKGEGEQECRYEI
jgi:hypothetical protein